MKQFLYGSALLIAAPVLADGNHAVDMSDAIRSDTNTSIAASFDVLAAHAHRKRADGDVSYDHSRRGWSGAP